MDYSLFDKDIDFVAKLFEGTLYYKKDQKLDDETYDVIYIPLDSPKNTSESIESIDLYFLKRKLVSVEYESFIEFDENVAAYAKGRLGKPTYAEKEDYLWMIEGRDISYALYMKEYPDYGPFGSVAFTQRYFTSAVAKG